MLSFIPICAAHFSTFGDLCNYFAELDFLVIKGKLGARFLSKSKFVRVKMASAMDVEDEDIEMPTSSSGKGEKKRFEVKKVSD